MKILILNWRDIKNPRAGGAEVVTHECARRWVKGKENEVTLFAAEFPGCKRTEEVDQVKIVRSGSQRTVHWHAFRHYRRLFKGKYDLIIDQINTVPFLTPLYAVEPILAFIHQLCRDIWWYETRFPVNAVGYVSEPVYLRLYRATPTVTVSKSTQQDLLRLGFDKEKIFIIPEGIDFRPRESLAQKEPVPTLIYVGRLTKSKRVHHVVEAFKLLAPRLPKGQLWLVGSGDGTSYEQALRRQVKVDGLDGRVKFWGRVPGETKRDLMGRAHALLVPSVREGWGLIVTEANGMSTPAVGYNVAGLRDSIKDEDTGLLTDSNTPSGLAKQAMRVLQDTALRERLSTGALEFAQGFSWDRTAAEFMRIVQTVCHHTGNAQ